jgi:hypothetical protein
LRSSTPQRSGDLTPPFADFQATSNVYWISALILIVCNSAIILVMTRIIKPNRFSLIQWEIVIATAVFFSSLWSFVLTWGWGWFYSYIFPTWIPPLAPIFGLVYAVIGYAMYRLAKYLPGNPVTNFCVLGGVEGLITHLWVVFGIGVINKVPMMQGVSQASVLVFATFEKIFYCSIILLIVRVIQIIWQKLSVVRC